MSYYICENVDGYVVEVGFKTENAAEQYIQNNSYMKEYWHYYNIKEWHGDEYGWGVVCSHDSVEGSTVFYLFETWEDAIDYANDHIVFGLPRDFDYDTDIVEIKMG